MDPRIMETEEPSFILAKPPLLLLKRAANGGKGPGGVRTGVGAKFDGSTALTAPRRTGSWDILGPELDSNLGPESGIAAKLVMGI